MDDTSPLNVPAPQTPPLATAMVPYQDEEPEIGVQQPKKKTSKTNCRAYMFPKPTLQTFSPKAKLRFCKKPGCETFSYIRKGICANPTCVCASKAGLVFSFVFYGLVLPRSFCFEPSKPSPLLHPKH